MEDPASRIGSLPVRFDHLCVVEFLRYVNVLGVYATCFLSGVCALAWVVLVHVGLVVQGQQVRADLTQGEGQVPVLAEDLVLAAPALVDGQVLAALVQVEGQALAVPVQVIGQAHMVQVLAADQAREALNQMDGQVRVVLVQVDGQVHVALALVDGQVRVALEIQVLAPVHFAAATAGDADVTVDVGQHLSAYVGVAWFACQIF